MPPKLSIVFLFILSLLPSRLAAQTQILGKIVGQVRVGRGENPPHPMMVELRLHGGTVESVYTDREGRFGFSNLLANGYRVVVNEEGYYPDEERADVSASVTPVVTIYIFLRLREDKKKEDPMGLRAAGSNPYLVDPAAYNSHIPKKALKEYARGVEADRKGRQEEAAKHYEIALNIAPDYYPAHNNLGSLYLSKSKFGMAQEQFQDAIRLEKNDAEAYFNLANVFLLTGYYAEAEAALTSGLQRRPDSAFGHFLEGCLGFQTGRYEDVEKALREALRLDSTMWQARLQLVNLYLKQQRRQDAIGELRTFLQVSPSAGAASKAKELLHKLQNDDPGGRTPQ